MRRFSRLAIRAQTRSPGPASRLAAFLVAGVRSTRRSSRLAIRAQPRCPGPSPPAAAPQLAAALQAATEAYVARRDAGGPPGPVRHPGGGGTPGGRVKCLHAHTAHQLVAGDNPAGAEVLDALGWVDPVTPCVQAE